MVEAQCMDGSRLLSDSSRDIIVARMTAWPNHLWNTLYSGTYFYKIKCSEDPLHFYSFVWVKIGFFSAQNNCEIFLDVAEVVIIHKPI